MNRPIPLRCDPLEDRTLPSGYGGPPDDPGFEDQYGLERIDALGAWEITTGDAGLIVAVLDSGVDYGHPDFAANVWSNPGEIPGNGIDDEGNGYVDDHLGYDFGGGDADPMDEGLHGTHIAGVIAAEANNGLGVAGIAPDVTVMPLKISRRSGSGQVPVWEAVAEAIDYVTMMRTRFGANVRVISLSSNGPVPGTPSPRIQEAIARAGEAGIMLVASAGNNDRDNDEVFSYPASYDLPNIVSVTATEDNDRYWRDGNWGATTVDLAAPGYSILSTVPGANYFGKTGTSFAAPFVSGAAALLWSERPAATVADVKAALIAGVDPIEDDRRETVSNGRLNARRSLEIIRETVSPGPGPELPTPPPPGGGGGDPDPVPPPPPVDPIDPVDPVDPPPPTEIRDRLAVGAGAGHAPTVTLHDSEGNEILRVEAFESDFRGGVRVATGDVNGDGTPDLIAGSGPGRRPEVRVFDGATGERLWDVAAFERGFLGGVFVSAGDFDEDGVTDVVITPDEGGGPRVRIISGVDRSVIADFFGIDDPNFRGGARTSAGDLNRDGVSDLLVAAGFGGGPRVAGYDGRSLSGGRTKLFADFFVFETGLRNGAFIASGDLDGDGTDDLIAGGGPGGGPRVFALSGDDLLAGRHRQLANFFGGDVTNRGGVRVTAKDLDGDARADVVLGAGDGAGSRVTGYMGSGITANGSPPVGMSFDGFAGVTGGVFVG